MSWWWLLPALVTLVAVGVLTRLLQLLAVEAEALEEGVRRLGRVGVGVEGLRRQHRHLREDLGSPVRQ